MSIHYRSLREEAEGAMNALYRIRNRVGIPSALLVLLLLSALPVPTTPRNAFAFTWITHNSRAVAVSSVEESWQDNIRAREDCCDG